MSELAKWHRRIARVESAWMTVASIALVAIMAIVSIDVVLRYLFNAPLGWAYDVISLYLMVALFFLSLAPTQADGHHVRVDILFRRAPARLRHVLELTGYLLAAVVMAIIFHQSAIKAWKSFEAGDVVGLAIGWPTWLSQVLVPLGVALLLARLGFGIASLALAALAGTDDAIGVRELAPEEDGTV